MPALLSWLTLAGVGAAIAGLGWDAILHARDPLLVQHEAVLTAANPAHVMIGAGLVLALVSQVGFLSLRLSAGRRRALGAVAALFGIGIAAAVGWSAQVSASQAADARRFIESTRAGILQYQNVSIAVRAGYEPVTPLNWPITEWVNPSFTKAGRVLDLKRPERLMYISGPAGPILAGAMFVLPNADQPAPAVAGGLGHWHQHLDLCYLPNGTIAGTNSYGTSCPTGSAARPTPLMLHVWIVPNPGGAFAEDLSPAAVSSVIARG